MDPVDVLPYSPFPGFEAWRINYEAGATVERARATMRDARESSSTSTVEDALSLVARWAAIDTGAIEGLYEVDRGFTYSVAVSTIMLDAIATEKGEAARRSVADAIEAYDLVLDASTNSWPVTEAWIRNLHLVLTRSQATHRVITELGPQEQPLAHGEYKSLPNNPLNLASRTVHSYASPADTPPEMDRLVRELRSPEFVDADAVAQAAYAHYAFVAVHPFADGNGRVARALASTFLYRAIGIPLVIFADQKAEYLDALEAADEGRFDRFSNFVRSRVVETIAMVREQVRAASLPAVGTTLGDLAPVLLGPGGLKHGEIDAIGLELSRVFREVAAEVFVNTQEYAPLRVHPPASGGLVSRAWTGYRLVPESHRVELKVTGDAPANVMSVKHLTVGIRLPSEVEPAPPFALASGKGHVEFECELTDLYPALSSATRYRLKLVAERLLRELVADAARAAQEILRQKGYI